MTNPDRHLLLMEGRTFGQLPINLLNHTDPDLAGDRSSSAFAEEVVAGFSIIRKPLVKAAQA